MSFKDDLEKRIDKIRDELRQERLTALAPDDGWAKLRDEIIKPMLIDAQNALKAKGVSALQQKSGLGVVLNVGPVFEVPLHHLDFDWAKTYVQVSSSWDDLNEVLYLKHATEKTIKEKVGKFVDRVVTYYCLQEAVKPVAAPGHSRASV